jgi:hypothetical protein
MILVANAAVLTHRAGQPDDVAQRPIVTPALLRWGRVLVGMAIAVLLTGTLVTGSGPHSAWRAGPAERSRRQGGAGCPSPCTTPPLRHHDDRLPGRGDLGLIRSHQPTAAGRQPTLLTA